MEQHGLLDFYKAIERTSEQMLVAAQSEDWDRVVRLEGTCAVLIAQLRFKSRDTELAPAERKEKARIMQRILRTDAEIRHLAEPWLNDLAHIIDRSSAAPTH
jgi:flagellar protein FliT